MPYTARQLITKAFYLSGIVARDAQVVSGSQINDGLELLNALLDFKFVQTSLIPYWTYNTAYSTVAGQEAYFIPNCAAIESLTFNLNVIRYGMESMTRRSYFESTRVDDVQTLPTNWYFNREVGGGTLYLYFLPNAVYPLKFMGKFALQDVTLDQDMEEVYDRSYLEYLRYALADYICMDYGISFPPDSARTLLKLERNLLYVEPPDLSIVKYSILGGTPGFNWGDVNIGKMRRPT